MKWRAIARASGLPALLAAALVGAAAILTLAAPPSDPARATAACFHLIELPRGRQLAFGCDGFTFLRGAVDPVLLLEPAFAPPTDFAYQSRPLHIGLAALLGRALQPVAALLVPAEARFQGRTPVRPFAGAYVAYVLINAALLVAAGLALQDALIGPDRWRTASETVAVLAGLAYVILSRTVKTWLFTPHTLLWGTLIPLWALAAGRRVMVGSSSPPSATLLRAAGAAGVAALAYGYAVLVPATGAVALGGRLVRREGLRPALIPWSRIVIPAAGLFALPTLAWIGISHAVSGGFYQHEAAAYRQFRWLPDAIATGPAPALAAAAGMFSHWTALAVRAWLVPALILVALLLAASVGGTSLGGLASRHGALLTAAGVVVVLGFAFWYLNGSAPGNRLLTLAPVVHVVAVAVALDVDRRAGRVLWTGLLAAGGLARGAWVMLGSPIF